MHDIFYVLVLYIFIEFPYRKNYLLFFIYCYTHEKLFVLVPLNLFTLVLMWIMFFLLYCFTYVLTFGYSYVNLLVFPYFIDIRIIP